MQTLLAFIFVFGIIVIVHEFGHFYFAKKAGILVREFAIGMGPKIFQTHRNETTYTIRALPIGGYVMMAGYEEDDDIRLGMPALLILDENEKVSEIDLSKDSLHRNGIPVDVIDFDFNVLKALAEENRDAYASIILEGYQVKFLTLNGLINLVQFKFDKERDVDFTVHEDGISNLRLDKSRYPEMKQFLSQNWKVIEADNLIAIRSVLS